MCGIAAIYSYFNSGSKVDSKELFRIQDSMKTRGPDGKGLWISDDKKIGLAHRRLSIIDLSESAHQPMSTKDGDYRIIFNGELYSYPYLRNHLLKKNVIFNTVSDTEVLLQLYIKYGTEMVHRLRGMFAFAIWDNIKKGLFIARDHFGIKPLYFHDDGSTFRCASQVKALLSGKGIPDIIEPAGHVGFFLWGAVPDPYTLYKNLYALPAGHSMWIDRNGVQAPRCFFSIKDEFINAYNNPPPKEDLTEVVGQCFRDSIKHHIISDVPVGTFLSSGIDSAVITALASEEVPNINAITLGFEEYSSTEHDEVPLAKVIAQKYGCRHKISTITKGEFLNEIQHIIKSMDQPSIDGVNTYFVAKIASDVGLKVALSGLGGDELLGGYPGYSQIPKLVKVVHPFTVIPFLGSGLRVLASPFMNSMVSPKIAGIFEYGGSFGGAYLLRRSLFMPWEIPKILDEEIVKEGLEKLETVIKMDSEIDSIGSPFGKICALELTNYMRSTLLRDSDWAGMAHSVEIRVPFIDIVLFKQLLPYPSHVQETLDKKKIAMNVIKTVPEEVYTKPKTGFAIPIDNWNKYTEKKSKYTRGLRDWGLRVYMAFTA